MRVLGAILCGGLSSRFGSNKALALLDGRTLVDHVRAGLAAQVDGLIACGCKVAGMDWLPDRPRDHLGPLGGLNAALHAAVAGGYDAVLSVPCDVPFLPADLRTRLEASGPVAYVADLPVMGLWPVALALDAFLASDPRRSMRGWAARVGAMSIELEPLANVNTIDDLDRLRS